MRTRSMNSGSTMETFTCLLKFSITISRGLARLLDNIAPAELRHLSIQSDEQAFTGFDGGGTGDGSAFAVQDGREDDVAGVAVDRLDIGGEVEKDLEAIR